MVGYTKISYFLLVWINILLVIRTFLSLQYSTITPAKPVLHPWIKITCDFFFEGICLSIYLPRSINWRINLYCFKKSNMVSKLEFGNESQTYTNFCQTTFDQLKRILSS